MLALDSIEWIEYVYVYENERVKASGPRHRRINVVWLLAAGVGNTTKKRIGKKSYPLGIWPVRFIRENRFVGEINLGSDLDL